MTKLVLRLTAFAFAFVLFAGPAAADLKGDLMKQVPKPSQGWSERFPAFFYATPSSNRRLVASWGKGRGKQKLEIIYMWKSSYADVYAKMHGDASAAEKAGHKHIDLNGHKWVYKASGKPALYATMASKDLLIVIQSFEASLDDVKAVAATIPVKNLGAVKE